MIMAATTMMMMVVMMMAVLTTTTMRVITYNDDLGSDTCHIDTAKRPLWKLLRDRPRRMSSSAPMQP